VIFQEFRKFCRRSTTTRRVNERRAISYPFGSPEWVENIQLHYLSWPKLDRRQDDRRSNERRSDDRRQRQFTEQDRSEQQYSRILLTQEERKLIADIYGE
jgi:hypothetical protein